MKIKTKDLIGAQLDWTVTRIEKLVSSDIDDFCLSCAGEFAFSTDWALAGLIIDREGISIIRSDDDWGKDAQGFCNNVRIPVWCAERGQQSWSESTEHQQHDAMYQFYVDSLTYGPTALIAAMRCFVASKLGAEVDVPDELVGGQQ
ncbi:phage protein NinX family protein [Burkholderia ubonensis]|uniref:phage protein NinX family protein n=1 Tax=Burkholderia ubonensis TaxID=101571 RepID=UPI00075EC570|nr:phage protein NinX family protein [Burkholderia ubonensis]KVZ62240.1 hypothetical protein WL19_30125 [Burkholderia ubonensis]